MDIYSINQTKYLLQLDESSRTNGRKSSSMVLLSSVRWLLINRLIHEEGLHATSDAAVMLPNLNI